MVSVSIIIPVYNGKKYLKQCLNSVLNQTLKDVEIICVDDGSTDGSYKLLQGYARNNTNIKLLKTEHKGSGNARNKALEVAHGKYVCFMDCDDRYYKDDALEILFTKAEENKSDICGGSFCEYYPKDGIYKTEFDGALYGYTFKEDGRVNYTDYQFDFGYHRFIYNREFLQKEGIVFPDYRRYQDVVFFVKAMHAADWFYAVKDVVYCYRMHGKVYGNMMPELWDEQTKAMCDVLLFAGQNGLEKLAALTCARAESAADIMAQAILSENGRCMPGNLLELRREILRIKTNSCGNMPQLLEDVGHVTDDKLSCMGEVYYKKYFDIKNSLSFKAGRAVTALPRKIRDLLKK